MMQSISSAEPQKLFRYSDVTTSMDRELISESNRLVGTLQHFETTCAEPGYGVSTSHLAGELGNHGRQCESIDAWVRDVGTAFQIADWMWPGWAHLLALPYGCPSVLAADTGRAGRRPQWHPRWLPVLMVFPPVALVYSLLTLPDWLREVSSFLPWLRREAVARPPSEPARAGGFGRLLGQGQEDTERRTAQPPRAWKEDEISARVAATYGRLPRDEGGEECVEWAQGRRESLGGTALPPTGTYPVEDWGARQYLRIFEGEVVQISREQAEGDLTRVGALGAGTAVVWDRGHSDTRGTRGHTYGHIAIIEAVQPDGIWVSQANWPGKPVMFIARETLPSLHLIPSDARALSVSEFRTRME